MRWNIDPSHSTAEFSVRHLMITNIRGRFSRLAGTIELDLDHPERATIDITIDAASIDTRDENRDAHLRSADFFDVERHPSLTFKSKRVAKTHDGFEVAGDLSMRGVTREVAMHVENLSPTSRDPSGNTRVGTSADATISRKDWGLTWNAALETGGVLVGDHIKISIEVSLIAAAAVAAA